MTPALAALLAELVTVERRGRLGAISLAGGLVHHDVMVLSERAENDAQAIRAELADILRRHPEALRELLGEEPIR